MPRFHVIGSAGAGKTVLASRIAGIFGIQHVELDALFWEANWQKAAPEKFRQKVEAAITGDDWVADGNFSMVREIVWARVETVVWLDYRLSLILWRLLKRTIKRSLSRELLWGGNRESLSKQFFTRDSLIFYVIRTHKRRRRQYDQVAGAPEYTKLKFIRLRTPRQTENWFQAFASSSGSAGNK